MRPSVLRFVCVLRASVVAAPAFTPRLHGLQPGEAVQPGDILHLEHVNLNIPDHSASKVFFFDVLRFAPDPRRAQNLEKGTGTLWANVGASQIHLPQGAAQRLPGRIGLVYPDLSAAEHYLERATSLPALQSTAFSWKRDSSDNTLRVTCPHGNKYTLYQSETPSLQRLDPRAELPGDRSMGQGIAFVEIECRPGTAEGIAAFYRHYLGAQTEVLRENSDDTSPAAVISAGPLQHIVFRERSPEQQRQHDKEGYDGHHIAIYVSDKRFEEGFRALKDDGLIFVNPRPSFGHADTLERAREESQFRFKDIRWQGELLHELEHEVRNSQHSGCPLRPQAASPASEL